MFIYNETVNAFIVKMHSLLEEARSLINIPHYHEIKILVHESSNEIGLYHPGKNLITLDKKLILLGNDKIVKETLYHELAHHLNYTIYESYDHDKQFRKYCKILKVPGAAKIRNSELVAEEKNSALFDKIKKLLKLGSSSNVNEAESALRKANDLLLQHNISNFESIENSKDIYMAPALKVRRYSQKERTIDNIVSNFNVFTIWSQTETKRCPFSGFLRDKGYQELQLSGDKVSVEVALWVASFLNSELDRLWNSAKKEFGLKGVRAKNSFFSGVSVGYKIKNSQLQKTEEMAEKSLIIKNNVAERAKKLIYKKVKTTTSRGGIDPSGYDAGLSAGSNLKINPVIGSGDKPKLLK